MTKYIKWCIIEENEAEKGVDDVVKEIRVIDENGLFDEIRAFLEIKEVKYEDYRLIQADNYMISDSEDNLQAENDLFIVPKEFAEQIVKVVYAENYADLTFMDKDGKTLIQAQNFHRGDWNKVTAFAFDDLNFHLEDIFE